VAPCNLGEGIVPVPALLTRLRGIGYNRFVTAFFPVAGASSGPQPLDLLPDAIAKLRQWTKPHEPAKPAKPAPAAARAAPSKTAPAKTAPAKTAPAKPTPESKPASSPSPATPAE
jgi:hypothetical protein